MLNEYRDPASDDFAMHRLLTRPIRIVDIGADPRCGAPPYAELMVSGLAEVIGFEPNFEGLASLEQDKGARETYLPHVVGDGGRHVMRVCQAAGMASLLEPNPAVLNLFHGLPDWGRVLARQEVPTVRLDDLEPTRGVEMIKIDIQGAELMVLQNATERLSSTLVLQTEVEFLELYQGQPLFADVAIFLRGHGFMLHRFHPSVSRVVRPMMRDADPLAGLSQLVWADAVFIRDLTRLDLLDDAQLIRMATLLHHCYRSVDIALHLLTEHDRRTGSELGADYLAQMQRNPPNVHVS
jgi:FkbM family methyltransferase